MELQAILDKIANKLRVWKAKLMDRSARLLLVNSVITSITVYHLTAFMMDKWFIKMTDKLRRGFLWNADKETRGANAWSTESKFGLQKNMEARGLKTYNVLANFYP